MILLTDTGLCLRHYPASTLGENEDHYDYFSTRYNPSRSDRGYIHRGKSCGGGRGGESVSSESSSFKLFTKNMCIASRLFSVISLAFSLSKQRYLSRLYCFLLIGKTMKQY